MGKGSKPRPYSTTREERNLRDRYAWGKITFLQYERAWRKLKRKGLIRRNGKVIN